MNKKLELEELGNQLVQIAESKAATERRLITEYRTLGLSEVRRLKEDLKQYERTIKGIKTKIKNRS